MTLHSTRDRASCVTLTNVVRAYARQEVVVRFDPTDRHFVFYLPKSEQEDQAQEEPQEIGRRPARNIEVEDLTGLATWPAGLIPQQLPAAVL